MQAKKKLKKWWQVLSPGQEGDEETRVMIALIRHPKFDWRSPDALRKESGVSQERVEKIIERFFKMGILVQSPTNEDLWGYWEQHPKEVAGTVDSLTQTDHDERIDKALNPSMVKNSNNGPSGVNTPLHSKIDIQMKSNTDDNSLSVKINMDAEVEIAQNAGYFYGEFDPSICGNFKTCSAVVNESSWGNAHVFNNQNEDQLHFIQEESDRQLVMSLLNNPTLEMADSKYFPKIPAEKLN